MFQGMNRKYDITIFLTLSIFTIATLIPLVWVLLSAFKTNSEIFGSALFLPKSWHFENFVIAWESGLGVYLKNSMTVAIVVMVITAAVACPAGYAFAKLRISRFPMVFYLFLFGIALPAQAILIPLFFQLRNYGLLDSLTGLAIAEIGLGLPFGVFLMRNFFRDLPDALIEAAKIDGAGTWKVFWSIMLPLSKPGLLAISVFTFLTSWNEFLLPLLVLTSHELQTIPLGLVLFQGTHTTDYGIVFAAIAISFIPSMLIYLILQRSFVKGLVSGAEK